MKPKSLRFVVFFTFLCISIIIHHSLFLVRYSFASVPSTMSYQGKVTNTDGVGINDTLDIAFSIWNADTDGDSLWGEIQVNEPIIKGLFDVQLGSVNPIELQFDSTYYLQIIVDGDILLPRTQLTTSPYAFRARYADSLLGGVGATGVGTENYIAKWGADSNLQNSHIFETDSGKVGIGTQAPEAPLHVVLDVDSVLSGFILDFEGDSIEPCTTYGDSLWRILGGGYSGTHSIGCGGHYVEGAYLELTHSFATVDTISFARSYYLTAVGEALKFAIDGDTISTWTGFATWEVFSYIVEAGTHTFLWKITVDSPSETHAAWIDLIDMFSKRFSHSEQAIFADGLGKSPSAVFMGGSVGIGTTEPTSMLTVDGDVDISGSLGIGTATPASHLSVVGDIDISGSRFHVGTDGNVGIGTTSPSGQLHIASDEDVLCILHANKDSVGEPGNPRIELRQSTDSEDIVYLLGIVGEAGSIYTNSLANSSYLVSGGTHDALQLGTNFRARVTISGYNGHVGIGTTSPSTMLTVVDVLDFYLAYPNGHVALIENSSTGSFGDVLALKVNNSNYPGPDQNFISFFKSGDTLVGEIQGNSLGGVSYNSAAGDYAEMLPRFDSSEMIEPGDIVGLFEGRITRTTTKAQQLLPVSTAPIVLGNTPPEDKRSDYEKIAFMGQVPVRVRGKVHTGDYILPSGLNDGVGIAISPKDLRLDQLTEIVGQAWESSEEQGIKLVNVAVNLPGNDRIAIQKLVDENKGLREENAELMVRIEKLEEAFQNFEKSTAQRE